jgi:hypothetical protein
VVEFRRRQEKPNATPPTETGKAMHDQQPLERRHRTAVQGFVTGVEASPAKLRGAAKLGKGAI